jgi:hypothetical protein
MANTKPQIKIINVETGEEIVRDANADEIAQMKLDAATEETRKAEVEANTQAKGALLVRLGLTADELKTILG